MIVEYCDEDEAAFRCENRTRDRYLEIFAAKRAKKPYNELSL